MDERARKTLSDTELDALLEAHAARAPEPSQALLTRLLHDAEQELGKGALRRRRRRREMAALARLRALLRPVGGLAVPAGAVGAGLVGLWMGIAAPGVIHASLPASLDLNAATDDPLAALAPEVAFPESWETEP